MHVTAAAPPHSGVPVAEHGSRPPALGPRGAFGPLVCAATAAALMLCAPGAASAASAAKHKKSASAPAAPAAPAPSAPAAAAPATAAPAAPVQDGQPAAVTSDKILGGLVAVVDGDPISLRDLREYQRTAVVFLPPEMRGSFEATLQSMIDRRLLLSEYAKNGIKMDDATVERYIQNVLQQSGQTREQVEKAIADAGLTWKDYFERMREEVQRLALVNMVIRARVNVPPEEVEREWKNNPEYAQSERLEIADILLLLPADPDAATAVRLKATEVVREARRNFDDAAKKYSQGKGAAEGGRLGEFERGTMAPYFERAVAGLRKGDVSEPVEGGGGLHIIKLLEIHAKGRRPLEEVREQIHDKLYDQRLEDRYHKWVNEDLRKEHRIEILINDLAAVAGS